MAFGLAAAGFLVGNGLKPPVRAPVAGALIYDLEAVGNQERGEIQEPGLVEVPAARGGILLLYGVEVADPSVARGNLRLCWRGLPQGAPKCLPHPLPVDDSFTFNVVPHSLPPGLYELWVEGPGLDRGPFPAPYRFRVIP